MPKTKVAPLPPDDVPIWDALVADHDGDPRPYRPTSIASIVVDDTPLVDGDAYVTAVERVLHAAIGATVALDAIAADAYDAFDALYPWPESTVSNDVTVTLVPALASLDTEATIVLPAVGVLASVERDEERP